MSQKLTDLIPNFRESVLELLDACARDGIQMVPTSTVRDPWEQARLWRGPKTRQQVEAMIEKLKQERAPFLASILEEVGPQSGGLVTNVIPGNSWHQWGEAVDCYWSVSGRAEWSSTKLVGGKNGFEVYARHAARLGLTPGGHWKSFIDWPHVQYRKTANPIKAGLSLAQIDREMQKRFGSKILSNPSFSKVNVTTRKSDFRSSYRSSHGWEVFETTDKPACLFRAGMMICADGAAEAYHPDGSPPALDGTANAGRPGNWWGIVTDPNGRPYIQRQLDPAPGFYVSCTALVDAKVTDVRLPARYLDATTIPYVVLPGGDQVKYFSSRQPVRLGDMCLVYNEKNQQMSAAIYGEIGPQKSLGEGSIALAKALGIPSNARKGGTFRRDIMTVVFPGSGNMQPKSVAEIESLTHKAFQSWGGLARLKRLALQIG